jgi:hypothetical protein
MMRATRTPAVLRLTATIAMAVALSACGDIADIFSGEAAGFSWFASAAVSGSSNSAAAVATADSDDQSDGIGFSAETYSVAQQAGAVTVTVARTGPATSAASVNYSTADGTAVAGTHYQAVVGTLEWAENDSTPRTISVPIESAAAFSGNKTFGVVLVDPSAKASVGNPGTTQVNIAGSAAASTGSLKLSSSGYTVGKTGNNLAVSVVRSGGSSGAVSVAYATADGTAVAGKDFTSTHGVLEWADGDAAAKTFSIPVGGSKAFSGTRQFAVALSNPRSGVALMSPSRASVTVTGSGSSAVGTFQVAAPGYAVRQGTATLVVPVRRTGGTRGAASVYVKTIHQTANYGVDYTRQQSLLKWADGDASTKSFTLSFLKTSPYTGSRTLQVQLFAPSAGAKVGNPGTASIAIDGSGAAPAGQVELSASSYSIGQNSGPLKVSVRRVGGSHGNISVAYAETGKTAVAGTDFTATSGTLSWVDGDASPKVLTIDISNAKPFSGTRSFTIALSAPAGGTSLSSLNSAIATIQGDATAAAGSVQLSASAYQVAQTAGEVAITVNRTGGSAGAVSVAYATTNGTAIAGTNFTATNGTLQWADGDPASKTISIPVSNASPFSGTKSFNLTLSNPTAGAAISAPSSASVAVTGSSSGPAPTGSVFWVYHNGVFAWAGDYSWNASINYKDTSGGPTSGPYDIAVSITARWGGFQPFAANAAFDTRPYKYLVFSLKPTNPNQVIGMGVDANNDVPDGVQIGIVVGPSTTKYGPVPVVGQWGTYKVPLADFALTNPLILKFALGDGLGANSNLFYVDDIAFTTQ